MDKNIFTQKNILGLFSLLLVFLMGPAVSFGQTCTAPNQCMATPGFPDAPASHTCAPGSGSASAIFTETFDNGFGVFTEDSPPGPGTTGANDLTLSTAGDTPSFGTGPETTAGCNGGANDGEFVFLEGSFTLANETHCMSAPIPVPAANPPALNSPFTLSFWYHMFGDNIGTLEIFVNGGSQFSVSGQQQTANCQPWLQGSIDMTPFAGTTPTVQICMSEGNGQISTFESDISIDHIQLFACAQVCELFCPSDITVSNTPGICGAFVNLNATTMGPCNNPVINDFNGTTDASGIYPVGTTTVTFSTTDDFGNPLSCSVDVTVNDTEGPTFTGCDDLLITLDPGDCCQTIYFDPMAEDNCGGVGMPMPISTIFTDGNGASGNMFDVTNLSPFPVEILSYEGNIEPFGGPPDISVYYTTTATTYVGNETNAAEWTLVGTANDVISLGQNVPTPYDVGATFILMPGESKGIFVSDNTSSIDYTNGNSVVNDGVLELTLGIGRGVNVGNPFAGGIFTPRIWNGTLVYQELRDIEVVRTDNEPINSGDCVEPGDYTLTYEATDGFGNVSTCELDISIDAFPNPINSLNCNLGGIQVSLEPNCTATVGADDILEGGPYSCYDDYLVELFFDANLTQPVPTSPQVTGANIGQTLYARVTDPRNNNSCWGTIFVEDKHIPDLECTNIEVPCADDNTPGASYTGTLSLDNMVGLATQDLATVSADFTVSGVPAIPTDINVGLDISHSWVGDLVVTITSPAGTSVELLNNIGGPGFGCAGDNLDLILDDQAAATYADLDATCNNLPAVAGTFQPLNPLSAFAGEDVNGTWTISVEDLAGGDGGTVNNVQLILTVPGLNTVPFPVGTGPLVFQTGAQLGTQEYTVRNWDGCGDAILAYSDWIDDVDCLLDPTNPYTKVIYRTWTATDLNGNSTQCEDTINLIRATLADLVPPPEITTTKICQPFLVKRKSLHHQMLSVEL